MKLNWRINVRELSPDERRAVLEDLFVFGKQNQLPYLLRMSVLLILSTVIATAGLLSDSAAVVIGAMLVAPLMNPVLAAAGAVVMGWSHRFYSAMWLVLAMGIGALLLSSIITLLAPDVVFLPEQVLARTRPTFFDLLIALAAGSTGAYTITRKESSAIPGVAVAVALLPPLASAGILLVTGEFELATRAVVLFLTNLIAMILAGALTFMAVGIAPGSKRQNSSAFIKSKLWLFAVLILAISFPLYFYSEKILFNANYRAAKSVALQNWLRENKLTLTSVDISREKNSLHLELEGANPPVNIESLYKKLTSDLSNELRLNRPGKDFKIFYSWTLKINGVWPNNTHSIEAVAKAQLSSAQILTANRWQWKFTQYDAESGSRPNSKHKYAIAFTPEGAIKIIADCGTLKGKYSLRGSSLKMQLNKFNWFKCRKDPELKIFIDDLIRTDNYFIDDKQLNLSSKTESGIMYFSKQN